MRGERNFELRAERGSRDQCRSFQSIGRVWVSVIPWRMACCAPQFLGVSRPEHWSALLFPPPGDLPNPGIQLDCPALQADCLLFEPPGKPNLKNQNSAKMKLENFRNFCEMNLKFCCLTLFCPQRRWQCHLKFPFSLCDFSFLFIYFHLFLLVGG